LRQSNSSKASDVLDAGILCEQMTRIEASAVPVLSLNMVKSPPLMLDSGPVQAVLIEADGPLQILNAESDDI
jgi:hypothetical protein